MTLQELATKKILLLGFAREGRDTLSFLRKKFHKKVIGIADQNKHVFRGRKKHVILHLGKNYLKALKDYDVIIKSPGISNWKIAPFLRKEHVLTSQTEIFFKECPGTIIGITGTKGKSTTASLIHTVLKSGGVKSWLLGNIGEPVLSYLAKAKPGDVFVYELSSFQLENLKRSPHIAVLLNIYPEHLDHHGSFAKYMWAKANIVKHQTSENFLIYNAKDPLVASIAKKSKAQKIPFNPTKLGLVGTTKPSLVVASTEPARLVGKLFGIPEKKIKQAIRNFKPLPHRLEGVGEWKGITFYNDSLATIPESTCAALDTLNSKVHTLIAGGFDRGLAFEKLGKKIGESGVKTLILFPTTGEKILASIKKPASPARLAEAPAKRAGRPPQCFFAKDMKEAVQLSYAHTPKGKICLLSPAASSFNMFKDYKDRGEQFTKWAREYGEKR